ncbi:hypothetical protein CYH00_14065 [Listeria monocytogenes serotype 1/2a]|nr:hypothetical protein [Listeria monocytogenes serotype 1/2a]HAO5996884.1 hypothetical protein [Listeria monocytogenes]HAO6026252.1 hypothetical protein [Listeria monocytogenes]HAO6441323.1 hypothetical protein [Listeria monocytogenes]HAO6538413.1 hypothetical protein [Listeria monocytogenes]
MRGIEFRGKIVGAEGFVYGKLLAPLASGNAYIAYDVNEVRSFVYISRSEKVDPETVGQYTGLKDKYGKKIFEGDIVDISVYDRLDWSSIKGKVVFLNGAWLVEDVGHFAITLQSETNEIEIIGNVHENLGLWEA